ncbi:MAG: hypothetical protein MMC33_003658 [Icmadophila ericetorum]|nr:hypothetical protein [Icmadophila ericetorum]
MSKRGRGGASGNKLKMTLGLPVGAVMNCCDNSGARNLYIISVKGIGARLNRLPAAGVGDMVMATVKKGKPELRKKVMPAVVVRQSKPWRRPDGVFLYFEDNAGVIVNPKGEMKGSAITGPVGKEAAELWPPPFRLLALGDPQLEGDTSLAEVEEGYRTSPEALWINLNAAHSLAEQSQILRNATDDLLLHDLPVLLGSWRKRIDLIGNDYYLAHIYRTVYKHTNPTHVTVLGDLIGSQWIDDEEFEARGKRFWQRVFRYGQKVEEEVTGQATTEVLGEDKRWPRRIINVAGNHDVGYAGDVTPERLERFSRVFGDPNWEIRFQLPQKETESSQNDMAKPIPELRIVVLNDLIMDTPALNQTLQSEVYAFLNKAITESRPVEDRTTGTILLTHVPLHKEPGICVDSPYFAYYPEGGWLKEQNQIGFDTGKGVLEGLFGMSGNPDADGQGFGRNGIILNGHDHEGCDVYHHLPPAEEWHTRRWNAIKWQDAAELVNQPIPGIREITVRSMMGDFGGNAGLLSAWFDDGVGEWRFEYSTCAVGVQHIWWAIHIMLLVMLGLWAYLALKFFTSRLDTPGASIKLNGRTSKCSAVVKKRDTSRTPRKRRKK